MEFGGPTVDDQPIYQPAFLNPTRVSAIAHKLSAIVPESCLPPVISTMPHFTSGSQKLILPLLSPDHSLGTLAEKPSTLCNAR